MEFIANSITETAPEGVDLKNIVSAPMVTGEKPVNTGVFHEGGSPVLGLEEGC
jgi:hypothetical protein